jgi:deazaflavin-dependent oxidoreductase (nitroreductase family)
VAPTLRPGEAEFLYLTTIGRRSGRPREIEIWFTERDGRYYVIAEHGLRAHWVQNLLAEPRVRARIGDRAFDATAGPLEPARDRETYTAVRARSDDKYGWSDGLVVEIIPSREAAG